MGPVASRDTGLATGRCSSGLPNSRGASTAPVERFCRPPLRRPSARGSGGDEACGSLSPFELGDQLDRMGRSSAARVNLPTRAGPIDFPDLRLDPFSLAKVRHRSTATFPGIVVIDNDITSGADAVVESPEGVHGRAVEIPVKAQDGEDARSEPLAVCQQTILRGNGPDRPTAQRPRN